MATVFSPPRLSAMLRPIVAEGLRAAREGGEVLIRRFRTDLAVRAKGPQDIVTEADLAAQAAIVKRISRRFPEHGILVRVAVTVTGSTHPRHV